MYWPGSVAYHVLETPQYGWLYNGTGKKNWDVPFMILPPPAGIRASIPENYTMYGEDAGEGGAGGDFGMAYAKRQYTNPQSGVPFQ
jgi:hypothetical protein